MKKTDSVKNTKKELIESQKKAEEYLQSWQRAQADYLNLKRRIEEERGEFTARANQDLILQILPVLDNFRRAFKHIPKEYKDSEWVEGIKHLEKQLENILRNEGLEAIPTVGQKFNPLLHEALILEEKKGMEKGKILEELEGGYKLANKVIKPAKVKVAK
jgi:molecular chaperone GrpE